MFLKAEDVVELTGYKKPALQRRWLLNNGYKFDVRADGRPALLVDQVNARQLKGLNSASRKQNQPNFDTLRT